MTFTRSIYKILLFALLLIGSMKVEAQVVQNLTAAGSNGMNSIFWTPFSSADAYRIYWGTSPNVYPGGNVINLSNVIGYSHTGLIPGQRYYYNVVAFIGGQPSGASVEVSAVPISEYVAGGNADGFSVSGTCLADLTGNTISPAPSNFTVGAGIEQNILYWDAVTNAISYTVASSTNFGGPYTNIATVSNRYYVNTGLTAGTPVYYTVTANFSGVCLGGTTSQMSATPVGQFVAGGNGDGFSYNGTCLADLTGNTISPAPNNFTVAAGIEQNVMYWDPVTNALSYTIASSTNFGGPYTNIATVTDRYYVNTGLTVGTPVYYTVTANFSGICMGGTTSQVAATPVGQFVAGGNGDGFTYNGTCLADLTGNTISPAPANFTVAAGIEQNVMYWDPVTNAVSYTIASSTNFGGPYTNIASTTNRYYVNTGLTVGTPVYYTVTAIFSGACLGGTTSQVTATPVGQYIAGGNGDGFTYSATCLADLGGNTISPAPSNFTVAAGIEQNILYWDPVTNAASYTISSSTNFGGPYNVIASTTNRYYVNTGLTVGTPVYYTVSAIFSGSCLGGTTSQITATPVSQYVAGGNGDGFTYSSSGFFSILSGPGPVVAVIGNTTYCQGDTTHLVSSSNPSYIWKKDGVAVSGATDKVFYPTLSGSYTVTTPGGTSLPYPLIVNPIPSANAGISMTICSGQTAQLGSAFVSGNSYSWTPVSGLSSASASNPIAAPTATTTYTLTEVILGTGCSKSNQVTVTLSPFPTPQAITGRDTALCYGQSVSLGGAAVVGNTYLWTPSDGLNATNISNPISTPQYTTIYTLTETVSAAGCNNSHTVTVGVNLLPAAMVGPSQSILPGVINQVFLGANPIPGNTYLWLPATGLSDNTLSNPLASPSLTTTYTLLESNPSTGCFRSNSVLVNFIDTANMKYGAYRGGANDGFSQFVFINNAALCQPPSPSISVIYLGGNGAGNVFSEKQNAACPQPTISVVYLGGSGSGSKDLLLSNASLVCNPIPPTASGIYSGGNNDGHYVYELINSDVICTPPSPTLSAIYGGGNEDGSTSFDYQNAGCINTYMSASAIYTGGTQDGFSSFAITSASPSCGASIVSSVIYTGGNEDGNSSVVLNNSNVVCTPNTPPISTIYYGGNNDGFATSFVNSISASCGAALAASNVYLGGNEDGFSAFAVNNVIGQCNPTSITSAIYLGGAEDGFSSFAKNNAGSCTFTPTLSAIYGGGNQDGTSSAELINSGILCASFASSAIYTGGIEDGAYTIEIINPAAVCTPVPPTLSAIYKGGIEDGGSNPESFSSACVAPILSVIYTGGAQDGFSSTNLNSVSASCGATLAASLIYTGGNEDGAYSTEIINNSVVCTPVAPVLSVIYKGGTEDGFQATSLASVSASCGAALVSSLIYKGGNEDGFSAVALANSAASCSTTSILSLIYTGGSEDGFSASSVNSVSPSCGATLTTSVIYKGSNEDGSFSVELQNSSTQCLAFLPVASLIYTGGVEDGNQSTALINSGALCTPTSPIVSAIYGGGSGDGNITYSYINNAAVCTPASVSISAIYMGGNEDGNSSLIINNSSITACPIAILSLIYTGGTEDGGNMIASNSTFPTCPVPVIDNSPAYSGGSNDGFNSLEIINNNVLCTPSSATVSLIYKGAVNDGNFSIELLGPSCQAPFVASAIYTGGIEDGSKILEFINPAAVCTPVPPILSAIYKGGNEDGGSNIDVFSSTCATAIVSAIYTGGNQDGSTSFGINSVSASCGASLVASPIYTGGNEDGSYSTEIINNSVVCTPSIPVISTIYKGGNEDGFQATSLASVSASCGAALATSLIYKGGNEDGFSAVALTNSAASCSTTSILSSIYTGGNEDGFSALSINSVSASCGAVLATSVIYKGSIEDGSNSIELINSSTQCLGFFPVASLIYTGGSEDGNQSTALINSGALCTPTPPIISAIYGGGSGNGNVTFSYLNNAAVCTPTSTTISAIYLGGIEDGNISYIFNNSSTIACPLAIVSSTYTGGNEDGGISIALNSTFSTCPVPAIDNSPAYSGGSGDGNNSIVLVNSNILCTPSSPAISAIYTGGSQDGVFSIELISPVNCNVPFLSSLIYTGGNEDGNISTLLQTTSLACNAAIISSGIYSGGTEDGFSVVALTNSSPLCQPSVPALSAIYSGGNEDGNSAVELINPVTCTFVSTIYLGGSQDGYSAIVLQSVSASCGAPKIASSIYSGGDGHGFNTVEEINNDALCTPSPDDISLIYIGGDGGGNTSAIRISPITCSFVSTIYTGGNGEGDVTTGLLNTNPVCPLYIPIVSAIYTGGNQDGYGILNILSTDTSCSRPAPILSSIYLGNLADGFSTIEVLNNNVLCQPATLTLSAIYSGGNEDGNASYELLNPVSCTFVSSIYLGGSQDGFSSAVLQSVSPSCGAPKIASSIYSGGDGHGFNAVEEINNDALCTPSPNDISLIYTGADGDGNTSSLLISPITCSFVSSIYTGGTTDGNVTTELLNLNPVCPLNIPIVSAIYKGGNEDGYGLINILSNDTSCKKPAPIISAIYFGGMADGFSSSEIINNNVVCQPVIVPVSPCYVGGNGNGTYSIVLNNPSVNCGSIAFVSSPIYSGGSEDGSAVKGLLNISVACILPVTPSSLIYAGGIADGYGVIEQLSNALVCIPPSPILSAIYSGGIQDGFSAVEITSTNALCLPTPPTVSSIYTGGVNEGNFSIEFNNPSACTFTSTIYTGASSDGYSAVAIQATSPLCGAPLTSSSIYKGDTASGYVAVELIETNTLCQPTTFVNSDIYLGDNGDGNTSLALSSSISCTFVSSIYTGGNGDGNTTLDIYNSNSSCPLYLPILSAIYSGGTADGMSVVDLQTTYAGCIPVPPVPSAIYGGGSGDGFATVEVINNTILCQPPTPILSAIYTGANGDGSASLTLDNPVTCTFTSTIYLGGSQDGYTAALLQTTSPSCGAPIVASNIYLGDDGQGFASFDFINNDVLCTPSAPDVSLIYSGGDGDGLSATVQNSSISCTFVSSIYSGGSGDGNASPEIMNSNVSCPLYLPILSAIYTGGSGDGMHVTALATTSTSCGALFTTSSIYTGGIEDGGFNIELINTNTLCPAVTLSGVYTGGSQDGSSSFAVNSVSASCGAALVSSSIYTGGSEDGSYALELINNSSVCAPTTSVLSAIYKGGNEDGYSVTAVNSISASCGAALVSSSIYKGGNEDGFAFVSFVNPSALCTPSIAVVSSIYTGGNDDGFVSQVLASSSPSCGAALVASTIYKGGNEDGSYAIELITNNSSCQFLFPVTSAIYSGGNDDGNYSYVLDNITANCIPTPTTVSAIYKGGNEDGAISFENLNNSLVCTPATPTLSAIYKGGSEDGQITVTLNSVSSLCPSIIVSSVYQGGNDDGSSVAVYQNPNASCPLYLPTLSAIYTGGSGDGHTSLEVINSSASCFATPVLSAIYKGGNEDGAYVLQLNSAINCAVPFVASPIYGGGIEDGAMTYALINNAAVCTPVPPILSSIYTGGNEDGGITSAIFSTDVSCNGFVPVASAIYKGGNDDGYAVNIIVNNILACQNPNITTGIINPPLCWNTYFYVPYFASPAYNTNNVFTAQLSDPNGSFASPLTLGTINTTGSGMITALIPNGTPAGTHYRIRVIASSPAFIGSDNGNDLIIEGPPTLTTTPSSPICSGDVAVLNISGASTYNWYPATGLNTAVGPTVNAKPLATTTYTIVATSAYGCTNTATITLTVNPLPILSISTPNPVICSADSALINVSGADVYDWTASTELNTLTGSSVIAKPQFTNTYFVKGTNSTTGCFKSISQTIQVNPIPNASVGPDLPICYGQNTLIGSNPVSGNNYVWSPAASLSAANVSKPTATPLITTTYTLTETINNTGCFKTNYVTITVNSNPVPTITGDTSFCYGTAFNLSASTSDAGSGSISNYQWQLNALDILGADSVNYSWNVQGDYTVIVTNSNGCSTHSSPFTVLQKALPIPTFTGPNGSIPANVFCSNDSILWDASSSQAGSGAITHYNWNYQGYTIPYADSVLYWTNMAGNWTLEVVNSNGCSATSAAFSVSMNNAPIPAISGDTAFCGIAVANLTATGSFAGSGAVQGYQWQLNGIDIPGATALNYAAHISGDYTVRVFNTNGCSEVSSIHKVHTYALPVAAITGLNAFCQGTDAQLNTAASIAGSGSIASYQWYFNGAPIVGEENSTYTALTGGNYSVLITNSYGCSSQTPVFTVAEVLNPSVTVSSTSSTICAGNSSLFFANNITIGQVIINYEWLLNGAHYSNGQLLSATLPGQYTAVITNSFGCMDSSIAYGLTQYASPSSVISTPTSDFCSNQVVLATSSNSAGSGTIAAYQWLLNGVSIAGATGTTHDIQTSGIYSLIVTNSNLCRDTSNIISINRYVSPTPVIVGITQVCGGGLTTLDGSQSDGGSGTASYQWQLFGSDIPGATDLTTDVSTGDYNLVITNSDGCIEVSAPVSVTVSNNPVPVISGNLTYCQGGYTMLDSYSSDPGDGFIIETQWFQDGNEMPGELSAELFVIQAGDYSIRITNSNGCITMSNPVTVSENNVTSVISGNSSFCSGTNTSLYSTGSSTISGSITNYQWQFEGNDIPGATDTMYLANAGGTYGLTLTNSDGCTNNSSFYLTEIVCVTAIATGDSSFCTNSSVQLSAASSYTSSGVIIAYQWLLNGSDIAGATDVTYDVTLPGAYSVIAFDSFSNTDTSNTINVIEKSLPTATISSSIFSGGFNISCYNASNGSIDLAPDAGDLPTYSYLWSNGVTTQDQSNLGPGTYDVTINDVNSCYTNYSISLTEPAELLSNISSPTVSGGFNISCYNASNGSIDFAPTGGDVSTYVYTWSNGAMTEDQTNLGPGTYDVTLTDANGCTASNTIVISEPALLTSGISSHTYNCGYNITCFGASNGSIDFAPTGGDASSYSFIWSNGNTTEDLSGIQAGSYNVTVSDANGCSALDNITLIQPDSFRIAASGVSSYNCGYNIECAGANTGGIILDVEGGAGCSSRNFNWTGPNGFSSNNEDMIGNLGAGTYYLSLTDANGCAVQDTFVLVEATPFSLIASGVSSYQCGYNVECNGSNTGGIILDVEGGSLCTAYQFNWSGPNGFTSHNEDMIGNLAAGTYTLAVIDANGCTVNDNFILTEPAPLSVSSVVTSDYSGFNVSVNGGNDASINIEIDGGADCNAYTYKWTGPAGFTASTEDISGIIAGTYTVTVSDGNTCSMISSITITEPPVIVPRLMQQANVQSTPNPFTEKTYIRFTLPENDKIQLSIFNSNGKLLKVLADQKVNANVEYTVEFDGSDLADGIYVYKLVTSKDVFMGKMILVK